MLNIFKTKQNGELTQTTKPSPSKVELNIKKANERIAELEAEKVRVVTTPASERTYNGKTSREIMQAAETSSLIRQAKKELDSKKKEALIAAIRKDPRLFRLGKTASVEELDAETTYLAEKDAAQKKYEGSVAAQNQQKSAKKSWEQGAHVCDSPVYLIPKQGYAICFDSSTDKAFERVFLKTKTQDWCELVNTGQPGNPNCVSTCNGATPLSKSEFTALLETKPSLDELCSVYSLKYNNNVTMSGEQIPLW